VKFWGGILGTFIVGLGAAVSVQAAPRQRACAEISGLRAGGICAGRARASDGLFVHCIAPVMRGTPQPRRASKPLPQINLQLVADCKAQNPRPAYWAAIASGSATWGGEPVPEDCDPASRARAADP
jgi:hypothetical protein